MWSSKYLLHICKSSTCKTRYLLAQLVEHVLVRGGEDTDKILWEREKYWLVQLFILRHRLNNMNEWYALNRRGYRK